MLKANQECSQLCEPQSAALQLLMAALSESYLTA
jgi:hypothetical protein